MGDFESALENADELVKLTNDLQLSKPYQITNDLVIDLNDCTLSSTNNSILFTADGAKLTIEGGTASSVGMIAIAQNGGEIIIKDGTYTSSKKEVVRAGLNGKVTIENGSLTGQEGAVTAREGNSTIVVNGGNLTGTDNFAIATNGSTNMGNNKVTINDAILEGNIKSNGYEAIGLYIANSDTVVVNRCTIKANGGTGICQRAGNVTINDSTVIATNVDKNGNIVADGKIGDDPTIMEGCSAVIFHETSNYPGQKDMTMKLFINNSTITGVDHSVQVLSNSATPNVTVKGGIFTPAYPAA